MSLRLAIIAGVFGAIGVISLISFIFQDNITRFQLNPRVPYQTYEPPPPPSYNARGAWAIWPDDPFAGDADVFYIHSTTYASNDHWNAPLTDPNANLILRRVAAPNEAGPFYPIGAVYAPRFRQATLFARFTHKFDGLAARRLAYTDIEAAFDEFLRMRASARPFIIVGYSEGALYGMGLIQRRVDKDPALRRQFIAAYLIGGAIPQKAFSENPSAVQPCDSAEDTACVVAFVDLEPGFDEEKRRVRRRSLMWADNGQLTPVTNEPHLCVNPLDWTRSENLQSADNHIGAASATGLRLDETPPPIPNIIEAQCEYGVLAVSRPPQVFLRRQKWFGGKWKTQDFNLFYHDLRADALRRTANWKTTAFGANLETQSSLAANGANQDDPVTE